MNVVEQETVFLLPSQIRRGYHVYWSGKFRQVRDVERASLVSSKYRLTFTDDQDGSPPRIVAAPLSVWVRRDVVSA